MAQVPYEFLVRWNHKTGVLQGAHVKLYNTITECEGNAQAVAVAGAIGFPLADVITALQAGSIIAVEQAQAELAAERTAHEITKAALAKVQAVI